jgi:hypothetical protein
MLLLSVSTMKHTMPILGFVLLTATCGPSSPPPRGPIAPREDPTAPPSAESAYPRCPEPEGEPVIARADLQAVLDAGIPALLAKVLVEPVLEGDGPATRLTGYRIIAMTDETRCGPLGLHEGDIVVSVNGTVVERPDDLQAVWEALGEADRITLSLIRGGRPVEASVAVEAPPVSIDNEGVHPEGP